MITLLPSRLNATSLDDDAVTVRPAIVDAYPNQTYELTIKNNSSEIKNFKAIASAFAVNKNERRVAPVTDSNLKFDDYLLIDSAEFTLPAKESKAIKVQFLKSDDTYILGVTFSEAASSSSEIGTSMQLASLFLDRNITDENFLKIKSDLDVKPKLSFGSISFGKNYTISSKVINESPVFLAGSGEVRVLAAETRLDSLSLTQDLPSNIYPSETIVIDSKFEDKRTILERLGLLKFEQKINVNNREIVLERQVISIPFEIVALALTILLISALTYTIYRNIKSEKNKAQVKRPKRRVKSKVRTTIDIGKELQNVN